MSDGKRNFFDLFDLPVSVDVNIDKLEINYKKLQKGLHPDNFVNATSVEQTSALRISSQVNDGYKILKNIETRIEYILTIKGFSIDDSVTFKDKVFLMKQLEISDFIESVSSDNHDKSQIDLFIKEIGKNMHDLILDIKKLIDANKYDDAYENLSKLKFYKKSINQLNNVI